MFHDRVLFVSALLEAAFRPSRVVEMARFVGRTSPSHVTGAVSLLAVNSCCLCDSEPWKRRKRWERGVFGLVDQARRARGVRAADEGKALNQGR